MPEVKTGLEVLKAENFKQLEGQRVGLMTNPSGVDSALNSTYKLFSEASNVHLTALFAPEHGFSGMVPDGIEVDSTIDRRTGLPVHSLYQAGFHLLPDMLRDLDVLVCDIQDIGVRYYTFIWTITYLIEACGQSGIPILILDRPNPLGGVTVEGPLVEPDQFSLVGHFPVPIRHGLTVGEMAQMVNALWNSTPADLTIVPCQGWRRSMLWEDTRLPWIPPSPNMPHLSTLNQYPGACLIEGTTLSEGRGTALPFEVVGAPFIDSLDLADALNGLNLAGVRFRPHGFMPTSSKWAGQACGGVQVYITGAWQPIQTWLHVILTVRQLYPAQFQWLPPFPNGHQTFDRLIGSAKVRPQIEAGAGVEQITAAWEKAASEFKEKSSAFYLYN